MTRRIAKKTACNPKTKEWLADDMERLMSGSLVKEKLPRLTSQEVQTCLLLGNFLEILSPLRVTLQNYWKFLRYWFWINSLEVYQKPRTNHPEVSPIRPQNISLPATAQNNRPPPTRPPPPPYLPWSPRVLVPEVHSDKRKLGLGTTIWLL